MKHTSAIAARKMKYALNRSVTISAGSSTIQKCIGLILALALSGVSLFAQGTVMPVPRQTWFTNAGAPAAGYWVCFYEAGSTTLADTYTTAALNVKNSNPLVLDSSGRGTAFWTPGRSYKVVLKSPTTPVNCTTGSTIWSVDNVQTVPASNVTVDIDGVAGEDLASGDAVYLSDGSGSKAAGQWFKADSDFTYASTTPEVGITVNAITSGATGLIRIQGRATNLTGLSVGSSYYISSTAGMLTSTAPTNRRFVGQADTTTSLVTTPNPPPAESSSISHSTAQGRVTALTNVPIPTTDVTAATTIYYTPYAGNQISLYDGTNWHTRTFPQLSVAVPSTTAKNYDVFIYEVSEVPTIELSAAWNSDNSRFGSGPYIVNLPVQDGIYVKSTDGTAIDATRRYVGSFRTTGVSGKTEDSLINRLVYNYYNRVLRPVENFETTASWTYNVATWRQARANGNNQVTSLTGVAESPVHLTVGVVVQSDTIGAVASVAIGLASTSAPATHQRPGSIFFITVNQIQNVESVYDAMSLVGYFVYSWNEITSAGGATTTFYSNGSAPVGNSVQSGILGWFIQ